MRIIHKAYKVVGPRGTYTVKVSQVSGLRLRKKVLVRAKKR